MIRNTSYFPSQIVTLPLVRGQITPATVGVFKEIWAAGQGQPLRVAERELAVRLQMSKRTVRRHLKRLAELGLLHIQRRMRSPNTYVPKQGELFEGDTSRIVQLVIDKQLSRKAAALYLNQLDESTCSSQRSYRRFISELRNVGLVDHRGCMLVDLRPAAQAA